MGKKKLAALIVCAAYSMVPAFAQDGSETAMNRTPTNAQKFLSLTPPLTISVGSPYVELARTYFLDGEISSTDACLTQLTTDKFADYGTVNLAKAIYLRMGWVGFNYVVEKGFWRVTTVNSGGPAAIAGLRPGDIVTKIQYPAGWVEGDHAKSMALNMYRGQKVTLSYSRDRNKLTADMPIVPLSNDPFPSGGVVGVPIEFIPMPAESARKIEIDWSKVEVVSGSKADQNYPFYVHVSMRNGEKITGYTFHYSARETSERVLAAAQYLKNACDRKSDLGF